MKADERVIKAFRQFDDVIWHSGQKAIANIGQLDRVVTRRRRGGVRVGPILAPTRIQLRQ
jgi:hypothetical protein